MFLSMLQFVIYSLIVLQAQIPDAVGFVNDFANVLDAADERAMAGLIEEVRQKSGGEIVVVTLSDLGGQEAVDVARDIGRQWEVGARGEAGDRERNAGVILVFKPGDRPGDGQSEIAIGTGIGAEGFVTDLESGRIIQAVGARAVEAGSFSDGILVGVQLLARQYADEFQFELTGSIAPEPTQQPQRRPGGGIPIGLIMLVIFIVLSGIAGGGRGRYRRRGGLGQLLLLSMLFGGGRHRGGWGGGGFGGGGFGGVGGGGGFGGGGAGGRF